MLNQKLRYCFLTHEVNQAKSMLEVGSGAQGLGKFYDIKTTAVDSEFSDYSSKPLRINPLMTPVKADVKELPFKNGSFYLVISFDLLEHIKPEGRENVISEIIRVAKKEIIIGFPCEPYAKVADNWTKKLFDFFRKPLPGWLEEHLRISYPSTTEVEGYLSKFNIIWSKTPNSNIYLHFLSILFDMAASLLKINDWFHHLIPLSIIKKLADFPNRPYRMIYKISATKL